MGALWNSSAKAPNAQEKRHAAMSEQTEGPCLSMIDPTKAATVYWLIIPLSFSSKWDRLKGGLEKNARHNYGCQLELTEIKLCR